MCPEDAVGMANRVDPNQTAALGSGSTIFAQICLENLGIITVVHVCT